jgi:hypothetical protein
MNFQFSNPYCITPPMRLWDKLCLIGGGQNLQKHRETCAKRRRERKRRKRSR